MMNTMKNIRFPIDKYQTFEYQNWDQIFPTFRGKAKPSEIQFMVNLIDYINPQKVIDLGVGNGSELICIMKAFQNKKKISFCGIDISDQYLKSAEKNIREHELEANLINIDWINLSKNKNDIGSYDFAFLTGNCLTHDWHGSKESTIEYFRELMINYKSIMNDGSYLFIDTRNFDYIKSFSHENQEKIISKFTSMNNIYYHGLNNKRIALPVYISDTLIIFHYYDLDNKIWSANDFFPITLETMLRILSGIFKIEKIFWDYADTYSGNSHFIQYLLTPIK